MNILKESAYYESGSLSELRLIFEDYIYSLEKGVSDAQALFLCTGFGRIKSRIADKFNTFWQLPEFAAIKDHDVY